MAGGIAVTLRSSCSCLVTFDRHAIPTSQNICYNDLKPTAWVDQSTAHFLYSLPVHAILHGTQRQYSYYPGSG